MVAGIAVALSQDRDILEAITLGIASGAATVLTDGTELCATADVERLLPLVTVETVS